MKATITKIEQADGYVSLTLDADVVSEIEARGEFEPTSVFPAGKGVEFCLFTDEVFKVGDTFVDGEWVSCEVATKASETMKTQGLSFMNRELDRLNSEE